MNADPDNPVRIHFGPGALAQIGDLVAGRPYALLTYAEPCFASLAARIIRKAGTPALLLDRVAPNPTPALVRSLCEAVRDTRAPLDLCIALGGGSVIDTAKAFAFAHGDYDALIEAVEGRPVPPRRTLPIIAIPTTAGTGSEVTCWATLWDVAGRRKLSLDRPELFPEAAILDPRLMAGLPVSQIRTTGLDALSHALESLWNRNADERSRALAVEAARILLRALPAAVAEPGINRHRVALMQGALLAGFAFSRTRTALAHSLSYAMTIDHGVAHGIACSFCLPAVMRAALGVSPACDEALAQIFACPAADAQAALEAFLGTLGVDMHPAAYGVGPAAWRSIVAQAFEGARGRNFIGTPEHFPDLFAALSAGAPERPSHVIASMGASQ